MIKESELNELLIFDLETSSGEKSLEDLREKDPRKAALWETKHSKAQAKDPAKWVTPSQSYIDNSALSPEFSRIVCASFCNIVEDSSSGKLIYRTRIKSFYDNVASSTSERDLILEPVAQLLVNIKRTGRVYKLCGHNIKKFDCPLLAKRMIINGVSVPHMLQTWGKKPWELEFVDTGDLWSMGAWDQYISLDLLSAVLGIPSPKETMKGEYVGKAFWEEKNYDKIAAYCEEDDKAVARIVHKLSESEIPLIVS
jgi:DNA polymerase elongation subunit (family B)